MSEPTMKRFQLSERAQRILRRYVAYPFFFLFAFFASAYLTFPYDRVRDFITAEVARAVPGAELEIVSLEPAWLTGVELEGVSLRLPNPTEGERPYSITLPRVYARAGILSYLFGTTSLTFEIEVDGDGYIEGTIDHDEIADHAVLHFEAVDLRRIGPLRAALPLPIQGVLTGDVDVTIGEESEDTAGTATLTLTAAALGDGRARLPIPGMGSGLTIERASFGDLHIGFEIEHGTARLTELSAHGDDAEIRGEGDIRLSRNPRMWALDLLVRVNVLQPYRDRSPGIFAALEMPMVAALVRDYRAADGAFQFRLGGTVGGRVTAAPAGSTAMTD